MRSTQKANKMLSYVFKWVTLKFCVVSWCWSRGWECVTLLEIISFVPYSPTTPGVRTSTHSVNDCWCSETETADSDCGSGLQETTLSILPLGRSVDVESKAARLYATNKQKSQFKDEIVLSRQSRKNCHMETLELVQLHLACYKVLVENASNLEGEWSFSSSLATISQEAVKEAFGSISDSKEPKMKWVLSESGILMCSGIMTCSCDTLACESFLDKADTSVLLPSSTGDGAAGGAAVTAWLIELGLTDLGFHSKCGLTAYDFKHQFARPR